MTNQPVPQATIETPFSYSGTGVHSGRECHISFVPAEPGRGVVFIRKDLTGGPEIPVCADSIHPAGAGRQTTLVSPESPGAMVQTIEHILAALMALRIDNVEISMDNAEAPIDDGSAENITRRLIKAGRVEQQGSVCNFLRPDRAFSMGSNDSSAPAFTIWPSNTLTISYFLEYDHPLIGRQAVSYEITPEVFEREIAPARTFCLKEEVDYLLSQGLIKGGSIDNAIVVGRDKIVNTELKWPDEMARHKLLDLIGDLALLGRPLCGHVVSHRGGHAANAEFVHYLRKELE